MQNWLYFYKNQLSYLWFQKILRNFHSNCHDKTVYTNEDTHLLNKVILLLYVLEPDLSISPSNYNMFQ
jgi:hypothetical protein